MVRNEQPTEHYAVPFEKPFQKVRTASGKETDCFSAECSNYRRSINQGSGGCRVWCERGDLNPHEQGSLDPKSSASTSSATFAINT